MKPSHKHSILIFLIVMFTACQQKGEHTQFVYMQDIQEWVLSEYSLKSRHIRKETERLAQEEAKMYADAFTKKYYKGKKPFIWLTRQGVGENADTLLLHLRKSIADEGFKPSSFHLSALEKDIQTIRSKENGKKDINKLMGQTEYHLTQALLRFAAGERYGYTLPTHLFNNIESEKSLPDASQRLHFDIHAETAKDSFYLHAILQAQSGLLGDFLNEIRSQTSLYKLMKQEYLSAKKNNDTIRTRLARVNMERARWRYPRPQGRYVWVNLAGFELTAVNEEKDTTLSMRVCGGAKDHKSPMLISKITKLELNPYWVIPPSIVRNEIAPLHTRDTAYFAKHHYTIIDKNTHNTVVPASLSSSQLTSGRYTIRQENGSGNSLGRMIFRFPNNFSVYLHDTNLPSAFRLRTRAVSHGCIRLERPLDLAFFLMEDADSIQQDKIRMEIGKKPLTKWGKQYKEEHFQEGEKPKNKIYPITSGFTVFLDYYTLYPNREGLLEEHPDNYQYDLLIENALDRF